MAKRNTVFVIIAALSTGLLAGCATANTEPAEIPTTKTPPAVKEEAPEPPAASETLSVSNFYQLCIDQVAEFRSIDLNSPEFSITTEADTRFEQKDDGLVLMFADGVFPMPEATVEGTLQCAAAGPLDDIYWGEFGLSAPMSDAEIQKYIDDLSLEEFQSGSYR